ncbi:response regulator [Planctomycetota bacterium]
MARILVIEDEKHIRDLYHYLLRDDYDVDFAVNGLEGFRRAHTESYDLVIADLRMNNWTGAESVGAINLVLPDTRIIIVSAYLKDEEYLNILDGVPNIYDMIAKPFKNNELLAAIAGALNENSPNIQTGNSH